ncbi:hypothetical protein ACFL0Q_04845 [Thermodesulfobacteriota bacterium]
MVTVTDNPLVTISTQKMGKLGFHQPGHILSNGFFHFGSNHLKDTVRLATDLIDQLNDFWYTDFHLMGASPFSWVVLVNTHLWEKRLSFDLYQFHTVNDHPQSGWLSVATIGRR